MKKHILSSLFAILFILSVSITVSAQNQVLPSGLGLDEMETQTNQYINENNPYEAALGFSIVDANGILYENISGYANKETNLLADTDTVYEWGSLTKMLTWVSVMQLWEQGKLDLTTDIRTYLPEHFLKKLSYDQEITMLDLMNHTGGWQDSITNVYTDDRSDILPLESYLSKYEPPQLYAPGTTVAYSNWGVTLAGFIIERVSGEDYCDYVTRHILLPLHMTHTSIYPLHEDNELVQEGLKLMTGYTLTGTAISGHYYAPDYPAAGAAGTLQDMELFAQAFLMEDTPLFSKEDTLKTMFTDTYLFAGSSYSENAHGLWYDFYQTQTMGHYGNTPQFSTHLAIAPSEHIAMIVMTNQSQEMTLNRGLGNFVFGEYQEETSDTTWDTLNFKKHYVCARTIANGYCRFYNFFQIYQVKETGVNQIQIGSPFMKLSCTRISNNSYIVNDGMLKGYQFYVETDDSNTVLKISTTTFDILPASSVSVSIDILSYVLAGIALLLTIASLFLSIRKLCQKKGKDYLYPIGMNVLSAAFYIVVVLEAAKLMTTAASTSDIWPMVIFYLLYLITGTGYTIFYCITKEKNVTKTLTLVSAIILIGFILYWQMIFI